MTVPQKHKYLTRIACGEYMATFDDDDIYGADYLRFMYSELIDRNVSLVKLGAWPHFMGRWEVVAAGIERGKPTGRVLAGSMWLLNVTNSPATMGYGFTYFFTRQAAHAQVCFLLPGTVKRRRRRRSS